jgi:hypothetical protein
VLTIRLLAWPERCADHSLEQEEVLISTTIDRTFSLTCILVGDDIILGPPKMGFTSNNRAQTRPDQDKRPSGAFSDDVSSKDKGGDFEDGFFRLRNDALPLREKQNGFGNRRPREPGKNGCTGR